MIRFLVILILIVVGIVVLSSLVTRTLRRIFSPLDVSSNTKKTDKKNKVQDVVYQKDDVVVLKGEAKDRNETD
ncbi:MAG: hypothetical protein WCT77_14150 [Bacteroidota bacterium]|jgi:hypothetical protein